MQRTVGTVHEHVSHIKSSITGTDSRLGIGNISVERLDIWRCTFPIVSRITWCWENNDCVRHLILAVISFTQNLYRSLVIKALQKSFKLVPVLFFYCTYKTQYTLRNYVEVLLKQLLVQQCVTADGITRLKEAKLRSEDLSQAELQTLLIEQLHQHLKGFIIIDAFDEISEPRTRKELQALFNRIITET
ncbi:hypothetical protein M422DRAFT_32273, partial [Sphaerobolus stellatus SS14]